MDKQDFIFEDSDVYHSKSNEYLSSHALSDYIKSPIGYYRSRLLPDKDSSAFAFGRAVHVYVLEGEDRFNDSYDIGGPINKTTGKTYGYNTKAYAAWRLENGKDAVSDSDYEVIRTIADSVLNHTMADKLLSHGWPESVIRHEYCGVPCQIRIDWFNPELGLVDFKSSDDIDFFASDFDRYYYKNQMAFYQSVFNARFGFYPEVWMIAAEKKEPFRTGVWKISEGVLSEARFQNETFIPKWVKSKQSGFYPTNYEEVRTL